MNTDTFQIPSNSLPQTFAALFAQICRSYFRNFFKNTFKAVIATAITMFLPELLNWAENEGMLNRQMLEMLQQFVIAPGNMLQGCLLSSLAVLTSFSFIDKVWFVGILKSIGRFIAGGLSWLNLVRNSATTSFAWGLAAGFVTAFWLENPMIMLTLFASTFLAGVVPECSGLIYFARFFWNRFYQTNILSSGLRPADEFFRGTAPGLMLATLFKATDSNSDIYIGFAVFVGLLLIIGNFRQKRSRKNAPKN